MIIRPAVLACTFGGEKGELRLSRLKTSSFRRGTYGKNSFWVRMRSYSSGGRSRFLTTIGSDCGLRSVLVRSAMEYVYEVLRRKQFVGNRRHYFAVHRRTSDVRGDKNLV